MKTLIVCYSYEGNTAYFANKLKKDLDAEIIHLQPKKEHKSKGFTKYVWGGFQAVMKKEPELEAYHNNINDYDNIIFASPVWAGTFAPPIRSFLNNELIKEKNVAFFYTHKGGDKKTVATFEDALKGNKIIGHVGLNGIDKSKEDNYVSLITWIKTLEL